MNSKNILLLQTLILSCLMVFIHNSKALYQVGGGAYINDDIGQPVNDGIASGISRKTYFKDSLYEVDGNREIGSYYASWGIYKGRDYAPHQVPVEKLTHVYIAFGGICGDNSAAYQSGSGLKSACSSLHDSQGAKYFLPNWSKQEDGQVSFVDDAWGYFDKKLKDHDGNEYKQIEGMFKWKDRNPKIKIIWSIGGWSYSKPFYEMAKTQQNRLTFIKSLLWWLDQTALSFIDGIDIDWEFPGGLGADFGVGDPGVDGRNYEYLIKELRSGLDKLAQKQKKYYELTTAIGVGPAQLRNWANSSKIKYIMPYLQRLGLMTYDFEGKWSSNVGFNSALHAPDDSTQLTNIDKVLKTLKEDHGMDEKMLAKTSIGVGFYGRSQGNVAEGLDPVDIPGSSSSGPGTGGTIEDGVFSYFDLYENYIGQEGKGINGWKTYFYPQYAADILYNEQKKMTISYQSPRSAQKAAEYVKDNKLLGVFSWTIDDDNGMLLQVLNSELSKKVKSVQKSKRPHIYAPQCQTFGEITYQPGMIFKKEDCVFVAVGWAPKCPQEGELWEKLNWKYIGHPEDFCILGEKNDCTVQYDGEYKQIAEALSQEQSQANKKEEKKQEKQKEEEIKQEQKKEQQKKEEQQKEEQKQEKVQQEIQQKAFDRTKSHYNAGDMVAYDGYQWKAMYWTNSVPGTDGSWEVITSKTKAPKWNKYQVYPKDGIYVTYNNQVWVSKFWNHGSEPGKEVWGPWVKV